MITDHNEIYRLKVWACDDDSCHVVHMKVDDSDDEALMGFNMPYAYGNILREQISHALERIEAKKSFKNA